jgi:F-type H+-transporting ATPase subunit alpha
VEIRPDEISALIKTQIKRYEHKMDSSDVGSIVSVGDGIATVYGLDKAMYGELLEFPNEVFGMVLGLEEEHVSVVKTLTLRCLES